MCRDGQDSKYDDDAENNRSVVSTRGRDKNTRDFDVGGAGLGTSMYFTPSVPPLSKKATKPQFTIQRKRIVHYYSN